jgi:hypothetical protein
MVEIDRRTFARAAMWTLPVVSLATASPAFAASQTPSCPTCLTASGGLFTEQMIALAGSSTPATAGTLAFNLNSSTCGTSFFQPAYTILGTQTTVTYNNGQTQNFVSAITGAGTFGAVSAFNSTFTAPSSSVSMPNDTISPYTPRFPTSITVKFTAVFVGLNGISISCPYTASFALTATSGTGTVILGAGTVNYSSTASGGTITSG